MVSASDSVGHARMEQWQIDPVGLRRIASESIWLSGAPRWPQTPEETLLAAAQAALASLSGEMNGYMTPALAASAPLDAIAEGCDLALPMKYPHADPRPCIGLLRVENAHLARIRPLYGRAIRSPGQQGPWKLEWIGLQ